MQRVLPQNMQDTLQKYFPTNDFGVSLVLDNIAGDIDVVTIDRCEGSVTGKSTWTHYANLQRTDDGTWELNEQFKGENKREAEAYVFGMSESFYITGRHGYFVRLVDEKGKTILERVII